MRYFPEGSGPYRRDRKGIDRTLDRGRIVGGAITSRPECTNVALRRTPLP